MDSSKGVRNMLILIVAAIIGYLAFCGLIFYGLYRLIWG